MFGRKKAAIGLDVGTHAIKVVEVGVSGSTVTVGNAGYQEITSEDAREAALRDLVHRTGLKGEDVVTSVAGRSVIVRYVNLRRMDEVVLDCQPIEGADNVGPDEMRVLLVAVKRNLIEEHVSLLRACGVNPVVIDVDGFALGNAHLLASGGNVGEDVKGCVDIGASKTNINVMQGDRSLFTREVYVGGSDFSAEISRRLSINPFEVEELKSNPGEKEQDLREAVQGVTDDLANEIRLSLDFFENEFDRKVESVVLSGGGSRMAGLAESLQESFEKPTTVWDPSSALTMRLSHDGEELFRGKAPQMTVAIGLAARIGRK